MSVPTQCFLNAMAWNLSSIFSMALVISKKDWSGLLLLLLSWAGASWSLAQGAILLGDKFHLTFWAGEWLFPSVSALSELMILFWSFLGWKKRHTSRSHWPLMNCLQRVRCRPFSHPSLDWHPPALYPKFSKGLHVFGWGYSHVFPFTTDLPSFPCRHFPFM